MQAVALGLLLAAPLAQGKVFWRWRGGSSADAIEALGGRVAYEAPVRLNDGKGHLTALGFKAPLQDTWQQLGRLFGKQHFKPARRELAITSLEHQGRRLRLVALASAPGETLVFAFEQSPSEAARSKRPPSSPMLESIPDYPASRPTFLAVDERTRGSLAISETADDPGSVMAFYRSRLSSTGWTAALPEPGRPPSLFVYTRGPQLCCVLVTPRAGGHQIAVLHKERGIE